MHMTWTDNPVRDAEAYQMELEAQKYKRSIFCTCIQCKQAIYKETEEEYGEEYCEVSGSRVHVECMDDWIRENKKEAV